MQPSSPVQWRATGPYTPNNASKTGLLGETRLYLQTYAQFGSTIAAHDKLVSGALPQRSRATRQGIVEVIERRLIRWEPPKWVLDDLATFAAAPGPEQLASALLLHSVRQDTLLYDLIQQQIVPAWRSGERDIARTDVQRFLDEALSAHAEIDVWSTSTRTKLAGNVLSILRDYGLLTGKLHKQIVEPAVPADVVRHLVRLLQAEGLTMPEIQNHADWRIFLWDAERVQHEIERNNLA